MKKLFVYFISLSLALIFCLGMTTEISAGCDSADSASISGRGVIYVPADNASIGFCVEARAENPRDARAMNDKTVEALKSACAGFGCISEDSFYSYEDPCSGRHTVTRCLTITTAKTDSVGLISQKLLDGGATGVNYICYTVKDLKPYAGRALGLAIEDAERKASELGLQLKLTEINDSGCYAYYDGKCDRDGRKLVSVECNVSVVFERTP